MKTTLLLLFFVLNFLDVTVAQIKRFSNEEMQKCRVIGYDKYDACNSQITSSSMDALVGNPVFTKVKFNSKTKEFYIKGYTGNTNGDFVFVLFVANKSENGKLSKIRILGGTKSSRNKIARRWKGKDKFSILFRFKDNNRHLFFDGELFTLIEYDLKCLIDK